MKKCTLAFKVLAGMACFVGFLTISSEFSRSQSEKPGIRTGWNPEKQILLATAVPVPSGPIYLGVPKFVAKETQQMIKEAEKISTAEVTPQIPKVTAPAKAREGKAEGRTAMPLTLTGEVPLSKLSLPLLLDHTEPQAMSGYLYYEILPGRGVRFRYDELRYERMGHEWFLKRPRDLRGKTLRIDYRGYVPREMTFRIARSGTSASVTRKVKLESSPHEPKSIFIEIPDRVPFKDVKYFEFWMDRESAGRRYGDFMIEKVVVIESTEKGEGVVNESRPEPFPFDRPFVPTNLIRSEAHVS